MPGTLQTVEEEIVRSDLRQVPRNRFAGLITATSCRRRRRHADVFTDIFRDVPVGAGAAAYAINHSGATQLPRALLTC